MFLIVINNYSINLLSFNLLEKQKNLKTVPNLVVNQDGLLGNLNVQFQVNLSCSLCSSYLFVCFSLKSIANKINTATVARAEKF